MPRSELATLSTRREAGRVTVVILQVAFFVFAMGMWQVLTAVGWLDPFFFSRPGDVALRAYVRAEVKFSGLDALKAQIAADAAEARRLLA